MLYHEYKGFHFFINEIELPYAPSELKLTINSNNQTVELIDGTEINILRKPKLTDIAFDIELPRGRQYPFANTLISPNAYLQLFEKLMVEKTPARLIICRTTPDGKPGTTLNGFKGFASEMVQVTLEGYTVEESAENAYDYKVSLKFKQYVPYGTVKKVVVKPTTNNVDNTVPVEPKPAPEPETHTVKSGDTLWKIAREHYRDSTKWRKIYEANKTIIENTARKYGRQSSQDGHWIYPGTKLTIPAL